jgi:four helix bundle protein
MVGSESCETRTLRAGADGARRNTAGRRHGSCAKGGMTQTPPPATSLPHHKLFAYELCLSLVKLVAKTRVADAQLRAQARKSAASAALNCAEGAARQTRADKSRAYAIALCECCEACAAITAGQPTLLQDAKHWLGSRGAPAADAVSEDFERGHRVVRRLFIGQVTVLLDGWEHLRTVLRIQTETFDASGTLTRTDERYLISSLPSIRLTADHWLLVARRHWGVETSHQILDNAFEEDDHPWIEACPRAALVVAILRRIAYTMLTLFRTVTQRSDERRAIPWDTLMTDFFVTLITTTMLELQEPRPLRRR